MQTKRRGRISAETDVAILKDLALGLTQKEIAKKHNVSTSYVSKVNTGKKKINVHIPEQVKAQGELIYYESDINKLEEFFERTQLGLKSKDLEVIDGLIVQKMSELKILFSVRKLIRKGD